MDRRHFVRSGLLAGSALGAGVLAGCGGWPLRPAQAASGPGAPAAADGVLRKIALGSCTDESKPQPIWNTVLADRPDLVLFGGDNVYASTPPWTLAALEQAYEAQAAVQPFARLRQAVRHHAIWDDHDYGQNDGGAEFPHKQASKQAFLRFWKVPASDPRHGREGIYHAETYGPPGRRVQVILLDTRWFKSPWRPTDQRNAPGKERYVPDFTAGKTMLGETQWQWLAAQLRQPADVRLIVSGIQVIADGHGWERWGLFPLELHRLYRLITVSNANGVVFLSGDRHIGAFYRETRAAPYPLYELTSSGITHPWRDAREAGPNRLGELFTELHYGTVEIDWETRRLHLHLKDLAGAARRSQAIDLNELKVTA